MVAPWDIFNLVNGIASIAGLAISGLVAIQVRGLRREVLLRGALEDLEKKLRTVTRNLEESRKHATESGSHLAVLKTHTLEIQEKCKNGAPARQAKELLALIDKRATLTEIIYSLAGFTTAIGSYRRDHRWKI